jgi:transcription elongation factor Elf1
MMNRLRRFLELPKPRNIPVFGKIHVASGLQKKHWHNEEEVQKDLQQSIFFKTENQEITLKGNPHKFATVTEKGIDPFKNTTCPFCLSYSKLRLFLISTKKGFDRGRGVCPVCGQGMKLQTLVKMEKWTAKEYAQFVFDYRSSMFWQTHGSSSHDNARNQPATKHHKPHSNSSQVPDSRFRCEVDS